MLIFVLAALVGIAAGLVLGGRLLALASVHLRAPGLVWVGLGMQVALGGDPLRSLPDGARFAFVVASYALVGAWLVVNAVAHSRAMRGALGLLAAGWLLNVVVMVSNGGMPVSAAALEGSGAPPGLDVEEGHLWKHVPASGTTVLPWLGDVVAVPRLHSVVSAGDIIMVAGITLAIAAGMAPTMGCARPQVAETGVSAVASTRGRQASAPVHQLPGPHRQLP